MNTPDQINSLFLSSGAILGLLNVRRVLEDKKIEGVSLWPTVLFTSWGVWDLYYFPHLEQWFSLVGSVLAVIVNISWLSLALYYRKR